MPTLIGDSLRFIDDTLRAAAREVQRVQPQRASYTDVKGYLADADLAAHEVIRRAVESEYSDDRVLSEEDDPQPASSDGEASVAPDDPDAASPGRTWIVDPICGTSNYVRGIPLFVHALSVLGADGIEASGVYHPGQDEMFLSNGTETTLNGTRVSVSSTASLGAAVVAVNGNQSDVGAAHRLGMADRFVPPVTRRLRILECANLELAWVACGRLDAYVNPADKVWDIAAGSLLIASAGGAVRPFRGTLADLLACRGVVASNGFIQEAIERHAFRGDDTE